MKREDLTKLGLTDDAMIDKIMALHGTDIEAHKGKLTTAQTEIDGLKKQLTEAGTTIEGFKKLDVDGIKAAADDYKAKYEAAQADAAAQVAKLKFDHALDGALVGAKAKNSKAVKALIQTDALKFNEADGSIVGLKEQLEKVKSENDYLFESDEQAPRVVSGGNSQPIIGDVAVIAARRAAGLPVDK